MTEITEAVDVEEALRLAEVGEYLYDEKAFSAGNGYDEPREFSICWDWQQSKPDEYGQGVLLAEAVAWHREMAADGIETQANKLRAELTRLQEEVKGLRGIERLARELISPAGMVNRGVDRGLVVIEKADKSDPHYLLCSALDELAGSRLAATLTPGEQS